MQYCLKFFGSLRSTPVLSSFLGAALLCFAATAQASGWPPFVADDKASVSRGGTVAILDSGKASVLANDFDIEGDPLEAYLTKSPKHGAVLLNVDGTFSYTHNGSKGKDDDFEYIAWDGTRISRRAKVKIEVDDSEPVAPVITGQNSVSVSEDTPLPIVLAFLKVSDSDSKYPDDFTIEVANGQNYVRVQSTITPAANYFGQLIIPVRVNDGINYSPWYDLEVDVISENDPPFLTGTPGDQEAIEGILFSLETAGYFDDIDVGDTLRYTATGLPRSGNIAINPNTGLLSGTPRAADASDTPYSVRVIATDQGNQTVSFTVLLTIFADDRVDLSVTVNILSNPISVAETAQWNIGIENLGPADLNEAVELTGSWTTSGANLTLSTPPGCTIDNNGSVTPGIRCSVAALPAGSSLSIVVQGNIDDDGDNTVFAAAIIDDPVLSNNIAAASGNVVAEFSEGPSQILGIGGTDIAAADFDGDGALDVAASGAETIVYFNSGNRSFKDPGVSLGATSGGSHIVSLDWNGDGSMDLATGNAESSSAIVLLNDGAGGFSQSISIEDAGVGNIKGMTSADFDQNGTHEISMTGTRGSTIAQAAGTGGYEIIELSGQAGISMASGDLDQDSFPDIVVVNDGDRAVMIFTNSGNGQTFATSSQSFGSVARIALSDVDQDGGVDLLLSTDGEDLTAPHNSVAYRQPDGGYTASESVGASIVETLLAGDIDGDAAMDLVAVNGAGIHQIYHRNIGGTYALNAEQIVSASMRRGILADFNNDSSLDLVLTGATAGVIEFHANNGAGRLGLGDRIAPQLTIVGEIDINVPAGTAYIDEGAIAEDDIEGDITDRVQSSGSVNTSSPGTYSISYSVTDKAGNLATANRVVTVGVNAGTGGSGGGALSPLAVLSFFLLTVMVRRRIRQYTRL